MSNPNLAKPPYSVVLLIYHRSPELVEMARRCLDSIKRNSDNYELIIVDNGSTERHSWEKHCDTYIRFNQNMGISHGWNAGIKAARGIYIAVLGDDTEVSSRWLPKMKECFNKPNCGVANPYVENLPLGVGIKEDYKWYSGACFMLTQNTIDKVGYFAEESYFPSNYEDWDYWFRVYKAGLRCYKNFSARIKHLEGQTSKSPDISSQFNYNRDAFLQKWHIDPTPIFCGDKEMPFV